ncbi:MAG: DUF3772 domain-containing protein [Caulobacteraceae bacterium]
MRILLTILAWMALASPVLAQVSGQAPPPVSPHTSLSSPDSIAALAVVVDQAQVQLRTAESGARSGRLSDTVLKAKIAAIPPIQASLAQALGALIPHLQDIDARLAQLGPAPGPGQPPEDPETAATRRGLMRFRQAVDTEVKLGRLLSVEADQASKALTDRLRKNFAARLWTQSRSILDPLLWREFTTAMPADLSRMGAAIGEERRELGDAARTPGRVLTWSLACLVALLLLGPARVFLNWLGYRRAARAAPATRLRRSGLALWLVAVAAVTPLAAGLVARAALIDALTPPFADLASQLIRVVVFAAFLEGLGRALLSPGRPSWRLAPIPDEVVARLVPYPALIGATAALAALAAGVNSILGASLPTSVAGDCLAVLVEIAAVGGGLAMLGRTRSQRIAAADDAHHHGESRLPWAIAALAAWLALACALAAVLAGYLALASFLMRETIWIGAVLALLFLLLRFVDDLFPALTSPAAPVGRIVQAAIGVSDGALEQIGVLMSGLFRLALLLLGWAAILAPFGASADDIAGRVTSTNLVFHLGQVTVSPGAILGGIALFLAGLAVTRAVRGWLVVRYLPKTRMDVGVRTSVAAAVTYLGALIAILLTFAYLGLSFSQIALFASALSVGIGFGLQSIIGNFVSGLILLAERPVKVGDWIAIGDLEGDVKRINIRATEIEMMDRSKLIVPNSDLVSKTVRNVTHGASAARLRIVLRTDGGADPAAMRTLMLEILKAHPEVLAEPASAVYLNDVRDGALEFTAFAYVASARLAYRVKSELLFEIVPRMKAEGIALASSTPVVNIGLPDRAPDRLIEPASST